MNGAGVTMEFEGLVRKRVQWLGNMRLVLREHMQTTRPRGYYLYPRATLIPNKDIYLPAIEITVYVDVVVGISVYCNENLACLYRDLGRVLGSGVGEGKLAPSYLTVESRPHEKVGKTESSTRESGFLMGASAD